MRCVYTGLLQGFSRSSGVQEFKKFSPDLLISCEKVAASWQ
jgi:hypothetical protein